MDYEKKYNEALERARQFSEHPLQEDSSNIVEYIFPELQESEDERIRKEILQSIRDNMAVIHKDKCIAWLEKQGEKKPCDETMAEALRTEYKKGIADAFKRAKEAFCKATCNDNPPRSTCTSLGTCKEYDNFVKFMKV